jgi:hypothetical protein
VKIEPKLHNVLRRAVKISIEEERRVVVYRDENDQWRLDRYVPESILHGNPLRSCILVNDCTGYEITTNYEVIAFSMPRRILKEKTERKTIQKTLPIGKSRLVGS